MGIYLGNIGSIEIRRKSFQGEKESVVNPDDVNANRNRFSFDFDESYLISGDFIELTTLDGTPLDFVDASGWDNNVVQSSGNWYANIDELGGIRLYNTFDDSLEGSVSGLVQLSAISRNIPIRVVVRDRDARLVGAVTEYELNTNRETVDITSLSDQYRQEYSSIISGSGRMTAHWDYARRDGDEAVHYLMQLVLRTEIGSEFGARFYIKSTNTEAASGAFSASQINDALWWEFDAVVTSSATSFTPGDIIVSRIDFVTTGAIRLKARTRKFGYLLQESGDKIKLEQPGDGALLLEETE